MSGTPRRLALPALALGLCLGLAPLAHAGGAAPDFQLKDLDGQTFVLGDHLGEEVIVLSFWATWCGPCKAEMPHLETMYGELKDQGLLVVSISVDDAKNEPLVKSTVRAGGYTFPVVLDQAYEAGNLYNPRKSVPLTVVIGKDKKIHSTHDGYAPGDEARLRTEVEALLGIGDPPGDAAVVSGGAAEATGDAPQAPAAGAE